MKKAKAYTTPLKEVECPHCGCVQSLDGRFCYDGNVYICESCRKEFEIEDSYNE